MTTDIRLKSIENKFLPFKEEEALLSEYKREIFQWINKDAFF